MPRRAGQRPALSLFRLGVLALGSAALTQPEALAVHFQNMDMVCQAVENGACEAFRSADLGPFVERQVGRDDDRAALVALGDDLEEQFGPRL